MSRRAIYAYQPTPAQQLLLDRWPDLAVLHHSDWERAAAHLDAAAEARRKGTPCPWCEP